MIDFVVADFVLSQRWLADFIEFMRVFTFINHFAGEFPLASSPRNVNILSEAQRLRGSEAQIGVDAVEFLRSCSRFVCG